MKPKVMVAMSGGVDSSVAASLLLEQEYDVCGATLKLFTNEEIGLCRTSRTCCSLTDVEDARSVAFRLGFDHYVFRFGDLLQEKLSAASPLPTGETRQRINNTPCTRNVRSRIFTLG